MAMSREEIIEQIQEILVDALGVDDDEVTPEAKLMGDLGADLWRFDKRTQCIVGQNSGCTVRLGQSLKVRIVSVNVPARQLNVVPVEPLVSSRPKARGKPGRKRRMGRKGRR